MADKTPLWCYPNLFRPAAALYSASSFDPAALPENLRYDDLSAVWRSRSGYNVLAGFNDSLDWIDPGLNLRSVFLTPGNYPTPQHYAFEVTAQMRSVAGPAAGHFCGYDGLTHGFFVGHAAGGITLKWATGPNAARSCGKDLGFATGSDSASLSFHTAPNPSYHSREWVAFDLQTAQDVKALVAHAHNLGLGGTALAKYGASGGSVLFTTGTAIALGGDDLASKRAAFFHTAPVNARYWTLIVEDVGNADGFTELGYAFGGGVLLPARGYSQGATIEALALSEIQRAANGAASRTARRAPKRWTVTFGQESRADAEAYAAMEDSVVGQHLFFAMDPLNRPGKDTRFGMIEAPSQMEERVGDGNPPVRYSFSHVFAEDLG